MQAVNRDTPLSHIHAFSRTLDGMEDSDEPKGRRRDMTPPPGAMDDPRRAALWRLAMASDSPSLHHWVKVRMGVSPSTVIPFMRMKSRTDSISDRVYRRMAANTDIPEAVLRGLVAPGEQESVDLINRAWAAADPRSRRTMIAVAESILRDHESRDPNTS